MEKADIDAIRILAEAYQKTAYEAYQISPYVGCPARRALAHAIKHLRYGFLYSKGRTYRSNRKEEKNLWD